MKQLIDARDHFSYVVMVVPDFPEEDRFDLNSAFIALVRHLTVLAGVATVARAKTDIEQALALVKRAYVAFKEGNERNGRSLITTAFQVFERGAAQFAAGSDTASISIKGARRLT